MTHFPLAELSPFILIMNVQFGQGLIELPHLCPMEHQVRVPQLSMEGPSSMMAHSYV